MIERPTAKIIFGQPEVEDAFPGGGHERSARAIVDSIEQIANNGNNEDGYGGSIGLEGNWGSGKSSVIRMAERALLPKGYRVFTFDMWAHQTDDFRRAFLEELLNFVAAEKEKGSNIWSKVNINKEREAVQNRKRHITDNTRKHYTPLGALLLLSLPIVALALAWIQPAVILRLELNPISYWVTVGLSIVIAFIAYLLSRFYIEADADGETKRWPKFKAKFANAVSEFLTISKDVKSQKTTQTIREEDPTTAEFQRVFRRILGKLQRDGTRLIFVLDNADRLPDAQVAAAWSQMRSLYSARASKAEHITLVIIPYDRNHIAHAFRQEARDDNPFQNDIIEKSFDRIIRVAPPVPSDWRKYLDAQFSRAFSPVPRASELDKLFRLFKQHLSARKLRVTPRSILAYVNDIGSLRVQWGDAIPLEAMALYVLHRHEIDSNDEVIAAIDAVGDRFTDIVRLDDWRRHLAALTFNVDPDHANQVLFSPAIQAGLTHSDPKELKAYSQLPGFWEVFDDVLRENLAEWSEIAPQSIARAATNVHELAPPAHIAETSWLRFAENLSFPTLGDTADDILSGLLHIVENQSPDQAVGVARLIEEKVLNEPAETPDALRALGYQWATTVIALAGALPESSAKGEEYWGLRDIGPDPNFIIGVAEFCQANWKKAGQGMPQKQFARLSLSFQNSDVAAAMKALLEEEPDSYRVTMFILAECINQYVEEHIEAVASLLRANSSAPSVLLEIAGGYLSIAPEKASTALRTLWKDGTLAWHTRKTLENHKSDGAAAGTFTSFMISSGPVPTNRTTSQSLEGIADAVTWFNGFFDDKVLHEDLLELVPHLFSESRQFMKLVEYALSETSTVGNFKSLLRNAAAFPQTVKIEPIADNFASLEKILGESLARDLLIRLANAKGEISKQIIDSDLSALSDRFLTVVADLDNGLVVRESLEAVDGRLASLSQENWEHTLTTPDDNDLRLLINRLHAGRMQANDRNFLSAMAHAVVSTLIGDFDPSVVDNDYTIVERALTGRSAGQVAAMVLPQLLKLAISDSGPEKLVAYFPEISKNLKIDKDPRIAEVALRQIIWRLIGSTDASARTFLKENASRIRSALKQVKEAGEDEGVQDVIEQAIDQVSATDEEWAGELRKALFTKRVKRND